MSSNGPIRRKLVIVGDGACGKTSLLCVFAMGEFPKEYEPTIFENYVAEIRLDGKPVQLALWDTAGQEEYERLRPLSYSKAHVILIAFSIDTPDSLDNVSVKWIEEVRNICGPQVPVILVGCKADLRPAAGSSTDGKQYVTRQRAQAVAQEIGARAYKECSALNNQGVDDVFEAATRASMIVREVKAESGEEHSGGCCVLC
ncbi:hypothetical protein OPQ81_002306 [Rhizoctonia solani]|nr:hypothetical protein OPQ81_002306 [Rhizoctonia solani]